MIIPQYGKRVLEDSVRVLLPFGKGESMSDFEEQVLVLVSMNSFTVIVFLFVILRVFDA